MVDFTEEWKAKFKFEEVPPYNSAFTAEEHIRILHLQVEELEDKVKTLDTVVSCLICVIVIIGVVCLTIIF
jgi:hypothetical protein